MSKVRHHPGHKHGPAHAGLSHDKTHYGGKPMEHPHHGHPIHHKRARGGGIGATEDKKEEIYSGGDSGTEREAAKERKHGGRKHGGKVPMHVAGHAAKHHRLDRPGRKRGGSVGADSHPMTEASKLTAAEGQSDNYKLDREDD
jgi:hypothetical protein